MPDANHETRLQNLLNTNAMLFNIYVNSVYFILDIYCFSYRSRNSTIVLNILKGKTIFFPVFEPFLYYLISANLIVPNILSNRPKLLLSVYEDRFVAVSNLFYEIISFAFKPDNRLIQLF